MLVILLMILGCGDVNSQDHEQDQDQEHEFRQLPLRNWSSLFLNRMLKVVREP